MKIYIANKDRSADIGAELSEQACAAAEHRLAPKFLPDDRTALYLSTATTESEYLERLIHLMWIRTGISANRFQIPHRRGLGGRLAAAVRLVLWKVLRYQHDRMAFQQTAINTQVASAFEYMRGEHEREIEELRQRIQQLESEKGSGS